MIILFVLSFLAGVALTAVWFKSKNVARTAVIRVLGAEEIRGIDSEFASAFNEVLRIKKEAILFKAKQKRTGNAYGAWVAAVDDVIREELNQLADGLKELKLK